MIFRFILTVIIVYLFYRFVSRLLSSGRKINRDSSAKSVKGRGEDLVEDPFCHTYVPIGDARRETVDGKTVYFCSRECFEKYETVLSKNTGKAL
jgi:uncharacterized protein